MGDTRCVDVEADSEIAVVDPEQLVEHRRSSRSIRVVHIGEDAADIGEPKIAVHSNAEVAIRPEADRGPDVVDGGDLGLHRTREVFVREIGLSIGRHHRIAFVRVACRPAAKITGNHPDTVDSQFLMKVGSLVLTIS